MKRRILTILALILLIGVGGIIYYFARDVEPVDNKLPTATPAPDSRLYGLDVDESRLDFKIEVASSDITGTFDYEDGTLEVRPVDGGFRLVANIKISGNSVDTGSGLIDTFLRIGLQSERYPFGVFTGVSDEIFSDPTSNTTLSLIGNLELSGVTNPYTAIADFHIEDNTAIVDAELTVDMADFGAEFPDSIGSTVLDAELSLVAVEGEFLPEPEPTPEEDNTSGDESSADGATSTNSE